MGTLYLAKGRLHISARGFWFTAGGEKGPFGYYPHLKDRSGRPVYPDTQIHGDLRVATCWLKNLDGGVSDAEIYALFGKPGGDAPALLKVTDLALNSEGFPRNLFHIKPRIRVEETSGAVQKQMLVEREYAWLEGCNLSADIYIGYTRSEETLNRAKDLISSAAAFIAGFGAGRSRGYGRGRAGVEWLEDEQVSPPDQFPDLSGNHFHYFLTARNHFRNRPVSAGSTQTVGTADAVSADQLRAWFVKTYRDLFGSWPEFDDLGAIRFPDLYPSLPGRPGYPPAMSTLCNEHDAVFDLWDRPRDLEAAMDEEQAAFFQTKTRPLGGGSFVTADLDIKSDLHKHRRFRNAMDESFTTVDNGLFVQELVEQGEVFGGEIRLTGEASSFADRARFIFTQVRPIINGTLFAPDLVPLSQPSENEKGPWLVTAPLAVTKDLLNRDWLVASEQIQLITVQRFNTMLMRPRRNRIAAAPGSVLTDRPEYGAVSWPGFGEDLRKPALKVEEKKEGEARREPIRTRVEWPITRTQAGLLREYLHPHLDAAYLTDHLKDRIDKYAARSEEEMAGMLKHILSVLEKDGIEAMRTCIRTDLEELALHWYLNKPKGAS